MIKTCPICGREFDGINKTCSKPCNSELHRRIAHSQKGRHTWADSKRAAHSEKCKTSEAAIQKMLSAKAAAMESPLNQKGRQNCRCKIYILKSPGGKTYFVEGLLPWARDNCGLFFDATEIAEIGIDKAAARIASALSAVASDAPSKKAMTEYKGWTVLQKTEKPKPKED